ncbi:hypothetical protein EVAR_52644_1 [Eumeta japonica]|uniref:Uncharacterized protein n=1 Tax=Eumeta variegata TaxID=151549 RepID=A0A4C1XZA8_EUMVA|nr:hypothetical protein EVAR_52644_1 [Eumeta japonica]
MRILFLLVRYFYYVSVKKTDSFYLFLTFEIKTSRKRKWTFRPSKGERKRAFFTITFLSRYENATEYCDFKSIHGLAPDAIQAENLDNIQARAAIQHYIEFGPAARRPPPPAADLQIIPPHFHKRVNK